MSLPYYQACHAVAKSPGLRRLFAELLARTAEFERLHKEFTEQITANRSCREGKPFKYSKSASNFMRDAEAEAGQLARKLPDLINEISEDAMIRLALDDERMQFDAFEACLYHEDDREFAQRLRDYVASSIRLLENFQASPS